MEMETLKLAESWKGSVGLRRGDFDFARFFCSVFIYYPKSYWTKPVKTLF